MERNLSDDCRVNYRIIFPACKRDKTERGGIVFLPIFDYCLTLELEKKVLTRFWGDESKQ